jgi:quinol-cytochrome oxidoreductase complex cytochrome b subunit
MIESEPDREEKTIPFYPDHARNEAKLALGILVLVIAIGVLSRWFPVGQGEPADPMNTPSHTAPEWYFLFLYEILKYVPKTTGVILPIVGLVVLALWPFFDRREDTKRARRFRVILSVVGLIAIIALTLLAEFT